MATQLELLAQKFRTEVLGPNIYKEDKGYSSNSKNALSDGDAKGKGELDGSVGSSVDIQNRIDNINRNRYNTGNQYSSTSKDAQSDGDEFGKGQVGENGTIGSATDIQQRIASVGRNNFSSKKTYPDF